MLTENKAQEIIAHIKNPVEKVDHNFKHWVKTRGLKLITLPALGVTDSLIVPGDSNVKGAPPFRKVVTTNNIFDVMLTVHENEMDHAGARKCWEYVSII